MKSLLKGRACGLMVELLVLLEELNMRSCDCVFGWQTEACWRVARGDNFTVKTTPDD